MHHNLYQSEKKSMCFYHIQIYSHIHQCNDFNFKSIGKCTLVIALYILYSSFYKQRQIHFVLIVAFNT